MFFVDQNGKAYAFRSDFVHAKFMQEKCKIPGYEHLTLLEAISHDCKLYIIKCGERESGAIDDNNRGSHWYMVIGVDRQNAKVP